MKLAVPLDEVIAGFLPERREHIKARAKELIAEELAASTSRTR